MSRGLRRRLPGCVAAVVLGAPVLAACSSVPTSPPTGVDGLVVPTPSPRPSDFVGEIGNPWLGWSPGATLTYTQVGEGIDPDQVVTVRVGEATTPVAGLAATAVTTTAPGGETTDWYAEDRSGNVWWLGRAGEWRAGEAGATAGLWMPAVPRTGDGFRQGLAAGAVDDVATVLSAPEADAAGEAGAGGDDAPAEARLEVTSELDPGAVVSRTYVRGRGLTSDARNGPDGYARLLDAP